VQHHSSPRRRRRLSPCGDPLQAVTFSLDADTAAYIEQLGEGNASAGIRKMLRRYQELPPAIRAQLLAEYHQQQETPPPSDEV
jgi:hypothetical protein